MNYDYIYRCRVCGYDYHPYMPYGENGQSPTYDICSCCSCEFGFDDDENASGHGAKKYREKYLAKQLDWQLDKENPFWFNDENPPANFNLEEQLKHIPKEFL